MILQVLLFTALTLLNDNSVLKIKNVGLNPTRIGFYKILKKQGKNKIYKFKKHSNEVYGDILVRSCKLRGMNVLLTYTHPLLMSI